MSALLSAERPTQAAATADLITQASSELPALSELHERDRLLTKAWLTSLRSARTRRAYFGDLRSWLDFLEERGVDVLTAGRVHVDLWTQMQLDAGPGPPACGGGSRRCRRSTSTALATTSSTWCRVRG